jgi:hypothetical protein
MCRRVSASDAESLRATRHSSCRAIDQVCKRRFDRSARSKRRSIVRFNCKTVIGLRKRRIIASS